MNRDYRINVSITVDEGEDFDLRVGFFQTRLLATEEKQELLRSLWTHIDQWFTEKHLYDSHRTFIAKGPNQRITMAELVNLVKAKSRE